MSKNAPGSPRAAAGTLTPPANAILVNDQSASDFNPAAEALSGGDAIARGLLANGIFIFDSNQARWVPLRNAETTSNTDASAGTFISSTAGWHFNGTTWDRARTSSAANIDDTTQPFQLAVSLPGEWVANAEPALNTVATATFAAGGAGVRHVCRSITVAIGGTAASGLVNARLRDGVAGAGTVLWTSNLIALANQSQILSISNISIVGTANTAMTLEFDGAGGANTGETVAMSGFSTV